jgi:hypothetical protein
VVGVVLPALALLVVDQHVARQTQEPVVQRNRANILAQAAAALTEPAWSLNGPAIAQAAERILGEPSVCGIEVPACSPRPTRPRPRR